MNLSIMKVEAVVSGVMRAVTINCESILPGLILSNWSNIVLKNFYHVQQISCDMRIAMYI